MRSKRLVIGFVLVSFLPGPLAARSSEPSKDSGTSEVASTLKALILAEIKAAGLDADGEAINAIDTLSKQAEKRMGEDVRTPEKVRQAQDNAVRLGKEIVAQATAQGHSTANQSDVETAARGLCPGWYPFC